MEGPAQPTRQSKGRAHPGEQYLTRRAGTPFWQITFRIDGHRIRESSGTADRLIAAELADKRWREVFREIRLGERQLAEMTLYDACLRYYTEVSAGTTYGDRGQIYHFKVLKLAIGANTLLSALDDDVVNRAVQAMRNRKPTKGRPATLSGSTINRYLTTLNNVCRRARKLWRVNVGPWTKAEHKQPEPQGRELFLEHHQARDLVAAACGHLQPILLLDMMTGLRRDNAVLLQWETVSLDLARAVLLQKGDRRLTISLPPPAVQMLAAIEPDPAKRRGPVFRFGNPNTPCACPRCADRKSRVAGEPPRPSRYAGQPVRSIKRAFATAVKGAGLDDLPAGRLRIHDLRHSFASWLLAACGDLKIVQLALGHQQITSTARYAHLLPGRKESAIADAAAALMGTPAAKIRDAG